jgi:hypothetical protein
MDYIVDGDSGRHRHLFELQEAMRDESGEVGPDFSLTLAQLHDIWACPGLRVPVRAAAGWVAVGVHVRLLRRAFSLSTRDVNDGHTGRAQGLLTERVTASAAGAIPSLHSARSPNILGAMQFC